MKISFKSKDTSFSLHLPIWLVNLIPNGLIHVALKHQSVSDQGMLMNTINFDDIKKSLKILKNYKGLNILELRDNKGDEITIKI